MEQVFDTGFLAPKDEIVFGDYRSGFQVSKTHDLTVGIGAAIRWYYENPTNLSHEVWASVGIIPIKGSTYQSVSTIKNLQEMDSLDSRSIPMDPKTFAKWVTGDSVSFTSKGGIIFFGSAGIGPVGASVAKISQGQYQTYVQKMDEKFVLVKLTKLHLNSLSAQVGASVVSIGASKFDQVADGMSYKVDVSTEMGKMAYTDLIRGNVAAVERLVFDGADYVKKYDSFSSKQIGRFKNSFFGLPVVLNTQTQEGKIYEVDQGNLFYEGTKTNAHYGVYLKDRKTKVFGKHFERTQSFYGASYSILSLKGELKSKGHFGQFVWSAETDASTRRRARNAIEDLVQLTGLRDALPVVLPTDERRLGYTDIDFSVTFSEEQTQRMVDLAGSLGFTKISRGAGTKARAYFSRTNDPDGICTTANPQDGTTCSDTVIQAAEQGGREMVEKLVQMKKAWTDDKAFVKAYADFGKIISRNQFLFQTALDLAGEDVGMNYSIKGRNVSNYTVNFATTQKPGVLMKRKGEFKGPMSTGGGHHTDGVIILPRDPAVIAPIIVK
jgi:hypothetical protein